MSIMSIISLAVSIIGAVVYGLQFSYSGLSLLFIILGVTSIILPPVAKKIRIKQKKKGKALDIIAIIIGGFNFYCIIFAFTPLPILIGYLGWLGCAIAYKIVK